jgi:signal transduction histidine kinase
LALSRMDAPPRGVVVLDVNSSVTSANDRAAEILGVALGDLVGSPMPENLARPDPAPGSVLEEVLEKPGGLVFHRYSAPICDAAGGLVGRVEVYSDITARRELEKEIVERNRELADLNRQLQEAQEQLLASERLRTLGEMAAGIAHDINNVLGIILGNAQLARRKLAPEDAAVKCVDAIEMAARDAAETVRRLREIGKPPDASIRQPANLSEIAQDVVTAAAPAWTGGGDGHKCRIDIRTELAAGCVVLGNPSELREALANVMLNSAQAIEGTGWIRVRTCVDSDWAELSVADNGCGMNEETKRRLFDPFFTTRGAAGTGLGMSMVDAIVMRHGGKVLVESEEGKGTTITMRFPRHA